MAARAYRLHRHLLFWICVAGGALSLFAGVVAAVAAHNLFDGVQFGNRLEESLSDRRVAAYAAEALTEAFVRTNPDLVAARPLLVATSEGIVGSRPFRALAGRAAEQAHQAFFSSSAQSVVLSLPDVEVLVRSTLAQASPELAAKIPKGAAAALASVGLEGRTAVLVNVLQFGRRLSWISKTLLAAAPLLLLAAIWLAPRRRHGLVRVGGALVAVALLVWFLLPLGRLIANAVASPAERGMAQALWSVFFGELRSWAIFLGGLGVLLAAGATSALEVVDPLERLRRVRNWITLLPPTAGVRLLTALVLMAAGGFTMAYPREVLAGLTVLAGTGAAYYGLRELFRLLLDSVHHAHQPEDLRNDAWVAVHTMLALGMAGALAAGWVLWRKPSVELIRPAVHGASCNGLVTLCRQTVDTVVFPGAHNAMSHQREPGWMFPHHSAGIPDQLRAGIRALLLDVHYGFPGGSRIKTDMSGTGREKFVKALGEEGFAAAMRIRNRLVGVREEQRDLYLCHGLCELGAYRLEPVLEQVRDFLVQNPDEVLIFIVEDYVTPQDLAAVFEQASLERFVYRGWPQTGWPTLEALIESGQQILVFLESGRPGVPWLMPAFNLIQETPYQFRSAEEFSCVANRGGTAGSLFLMNHWVETIPAPRPSHASFVNTREFLLNRIRQCESERGKLPNILAVDFFDVGDVVAVARELNERWVTGKAEALPQRAAPQ